MWMLVILIMIIITIITYIIIHPAISYTSVVITHSVMCGTVITMPPDITYNFMYKSSNEECLACLSVSN